MKRDMDLCRRILQYIESNSAPVGTSYTLDVADFGYDATESNQDMLNYNVRLLASAGLIDTRGGSERIGAPYVTGLTWSGHEFVENSRDQGLWEKAKELTKEKTGGVAFEILSSLLTSLAKKALGLEA